MSLKRLKGVLLSYLEAAASQPGVPFAAERSDRSRHRLTAHGLTSRN
jgi:hypothetical protein